MYDKKLKKWTHTELSENTQYDPDGHNSEDMEQRFSIADKALENAKNGSDSIDSVYEMETLAKEGYPDACYAMGQLFEYGWAVSKSKKQAYIWYEKAARLGSAEAAEIINRRKKKRLNVIAVAVIAVILITTSALFCAFFFPNVFSPSDKEKETELSVLLPDGIDYQKPDDTNKHSAAIRELQQKYDNDNMKSGKEHTNRILLIYKGDKLDLSKFDVKAAVGDDEYVIIQFDNADDAQKCMDYLKSLEGTVAVQYGEYIPGAISAPSTTSASYSYPLAYHSSESGFDYYSWGAQAMNFDKYSVYLQSILPEDRSVTVAVVDSGVQPWPATEDRIIDGFDYNGNYPDGKHDYNGHGTHVAGTILDCTQGLNIKVLPVAVSDPNLDNGRSMTTEGIVNGVKFATEKKVDVINMSLSGPNTEDDAHKLEEYWVNKAIDSGIVVCVAAGNEATEAQTRMPACIERCITVSGIDENGKSFDHTNYGSVIDVCGPAVDVLSYSNESEDVCYKTGTSMACPHISAMAAMMQLEYNESPDVIAFYMKSYCKKIGSDPNYFGTGMPDGSMIVE